MQYRNLYSGKFLSRPNRFVAYVEIEGKEIRCHVKNTGRCAELLLPGAQVYLSRSENENRATAFDLIAVQSGQRLVNIDSMAPNRVLDEALRSGLLGPLDHLQAEYRYGASRLDFYAEQKERKMLIEAKGVTLFSDGIALFPDAPTERGIKHLQELAAAVQAGYEGLAVFVIQARGLTGFAPNPAQPAFAAALRRAREEGVQLLAYDCSVTPDTVALGDPIPVIL